MLNSKLLDKFDALQAKLQSSVNFFQFKYYRKISKKLSDPSTSPTCYWTLLKTLLNSRKIPCISPFFHDNKFITDFKEKSEIFNSFFAKQCSLIDNESTLPSLFPLTTENSLSFVDTRQRISKTLSADLIQIKLMVTIWSVFACLNYVTNSFVNLSILSSNLSWSKAFSHQNRKKQMS